MMKRSETSGGKTGRKGGPLRIGMIGLGDISSVYVNHLKEAGTVQVLGCASRGLDKAKAKAAEHGIERAYESADALIADEDIDLILNLTTPMAHYEINKKALKAGKHVYTEKPLAATFEEAKELYNLAQEKGLRLGSAPDTFFGSRLQTYRRLIDEGELGQVLGFGAYVVSHGHEWHHPSPDFFYREGAGPLLDIGPYYVTALLSLLGPVKRVAGRSNRVEGAREIPWGPGKGRSIAVDVDTTVTALLEFENGAIGNLVASFDVWDSNLPRMEIYGTKGTLCMDEADPVSGPNLFGGKVLMRSRENYRWKGPERPDSVADWKEVDDGRPFGSISHEKNSRGIGLVDMAMAIDEGRPHRASAEMALHSMEVMEGILVSAREGRFIDMTTTFKKPDAVPKDFLKVE